MRVFKKIMYIILALVPILPLLLFAVCNVGNTNGVDIMPFGSFTVVDIETAGYPSGGMDSQNAVYVEKNTIIFNVFSGCMPADSYIYIEDVQVFEGDRTQLNTGLPAGIYRVYVDQNETSQQRFFSRITSIYRWFSSAGITPPSYVVFVFSYLTYMLFIHVSFMIFDVIVFVPKKISEMLEG